MKILIIAPIGSTFVTGLANAVNITKKILKKKNYIFLIDTAEGVNEKNIRKLSFFRIKKFIKVFYLFLKKIAKFDIVYMTISMSTLGFIRDLLFIIISKFFKKKVFLHFHGGGYRKFFYIKKNYLLKFLIKIILNKCDKLFILSKIIKNDFIFIKNKKKIRILKNTVDFKIKERTKKKFNSLKLIYLSNFIETKGYDLVIKTCRLLKENDINFKCEMYGKFIKSDKGKVCNDNNLKKNFINYIKKNNLKKNINFNENINSRTKFKKLQKANVFILPTSYSGEGLPLSILEAMLCETPIISTNQGAITDAVKHGYNGFILDKLNEKRIYYYLLKLLKNKKLFEKMSKNSKILFNKKFSFKLIHDQTLKEFCE